MRGAIIAAIVVAVLGGLGLGNFDPPSSLVEGGIPAVEPTAMMQPEEIVPETETVDAPEEPQDAVWQEVWEEPEYEHAWEETERYSEPEPSDGTPDLKRDGVVYSGGETYTWYSENVLPGNGLTDLNNNGRTTNDEGFVTDGDGYIAIASPDESIPIGTEVETPWGTAKVYDYNPGTSWDVYTGW